MNILHIVTYYFQTKVFEKQFAKLGNKKDFNQHIFVANRKINSNNMQTPHDSSSIYFNGLTEMDSFLYYPRIKKSFDNLEKNINLKNIDILHAHCVFIDGAIALKIKQKYNIDYIVSVRADTEEYLKLPHARIILKKILLNAKAIIYISPSMINIVKQNVDFQTQEEIKNKTHIIPNGIDDYWHENIQLKEYVKDDYLKFIQVSTLIPRKQIDKSIRLIHYLNTNDVKAKLVIIGEGKERKQLSNLIRKLKMQDNIEFIAKITDKEKLIKEYRKADIFIMPSLRETFGLVYIEAMSQGLPIIYKTGTGIDGLFEHSIGFPIKEFNYHEIGKNVEKVLNEYQTISCNCVTQSKDFKWSNITDKLYSIYCNK